MKQLNVKVDDALHKKLRDRAIRTGVPVARQVRDALAAYLKKGEKRDE